MGAPLTGGRASLRATGKQGALVGQGSGHDQPLTCSRRGPGTVSDQSLHLPGSHSIWFDLLPWPRSRRAATVRSDVDSTQALQGTRARGPWRTPPSVTRRPVINPVSAIAPWPTPDQQRRFVRYQPDPASRHGNRTACRSLASGGGATQSEIFAARSRTVAAFRPARSMSPAWTPDACHPRAPCPAGAGRQVCGLAPARAIG